jgi:dinuclear metal center YbgI/SA1388 family protein
VKVRSKPSLGSSPGVEDPGSDGRQSLRPLILLSFIDKRDAPCQASGIDGNRILLALEGRNSAGIQAEWLIRKQSLQTPVLTRYDSVLTLKTLSIYLPRTPHPQIESTMPTIHEIANLLKKFAPLELAAEWDNVGLLVGQRDRAANRIMTCLTITPLSAQEAISEQADLIITHHPLPFRPITRLTDDTTEGHLLLRLIEAKVAIYSPHTAFDSARSGINQNLAKGLGLTQIKPLTTNENDADSGDGRHGVVSSPIELVELARRVKTFLALPQVRVVGKLSQAVTRIGISCGSGGTLLATAREQDCDGFVTGETNFHTCLEAMATGVGCVITGHFASERFGVEKLADYLAAQLPSIKVWASHLEADPVCTV